MIKCPNCTGELNFDPKATKVKCEYCGSIFDPKELKTKVKKTKEVETIEGKGYSCSQCGATVMTFDNTAVTFCSYCGSQAMIEANMIEQNKPDWIIPFKKDKNDCIEAYKKVLNRALFTPNSLKETATLEKFRGIYMPYCVYDLTSSGDNVFDGSKYSHRSGDYQIYNDYKIHTNVDSYCNGISYDMSSTFYDDYSQAIPFETKDKESFNPNYLPGYYADKPDVPLETYDKMALNIAKSESKSYLVKTSQFRSHGCYNPMLDYEIKSRSIALYPIYFLAIRDKKEKNVYYAIVNGQTGKVAADLPVSFSKYIIASLILSVIIFLIINFNLVVNPISLCIFAGVMAIASIFMSITQLSAIDRKKNHANDEGYMSKMENRKKKEKIFGFRYLYKQIIALILPFIFVFSSVADDRYFYGSALISLLLVLLSFKELVKEHNILVSNKLPQLEKRGGDENA